MMLIEQIANAFKRITIITDLMTKINAQLMNLGHFKGHKKVLMYVPIQTDIERLKTLLIEKYNVSFNLF